MDSGRGRTVLAGLLLIGLVLGTVALFGHGGGSVDGGADDDGTARTTDGTGAEGTPTATPSPTATTPTTPAPDADGDGLGDGREAEFGSDPQRVDTDGDGFDDQQEANWGTNPTAPDTDGDGLNDSEENARFTTNPTTPDTDGDDLADGAEVDAGADPLATDSDRDGILDGEEADRGTDPTAADTDDDGLTDAEEREYGTDPTTPTEVVTETFSLERKLELGLDPTVAVDNDGADGDGDGVSADLESAIGTDPDDRNTDGDAFADGEEVIERGYPDAHPAEQDIYVEVDVAAGAEDVDDATALVAEEFADHGLQIHFFHSREDFADTLSSDVLHNASFMRPYFDNESKHYHYGVVVQRLAKGGDEPWAGVANLNRFVAEAHPSYGKATRAGLIMHELGHAFGLGMRPSRFDLTGGRAPVDQRTDPERYRSVMNYEVLDYRVGYANGSGDVGVDEWQLVRERRYFQNGLWEWADSEAVRQCKANGNWPRCRTVLEDFPP